MDYIKSAILGVVEGFTEFIPVSSTGHLIIVGNLLHFNGPESSTFEVFIQLGAILAVCIIYKASLLEMFKLKKEGFFGIRGIFLLGLTSLPALFMGALAHSTIKHYLFNPSSVALALGAGGCAILMVEKFLPQSRIENLDGLTWREALAIGLFQCLALWPGMSRSACTILGALLLGINRKTAVEYSFLAAIPVIFAATIFDLYKSWDSLSIAAAPTFTIGFGVAFISAWFAIKFFLKLVQTQTLRPFGWYRICIAPIILYFSF